ncbi:hypothetical protein ACTJ3B_004393, partial [Escherichia coli]
ITSLTFGSYVPPCLSDLMAKVHGQICSKNMSCTGQDNNYHPERKNTHGQDESTCYSMIPAMF